MRHWVERGADSFPGPRVASPGIEPGHRPYESQFSTNWPASPISREEESRTPTRPPLRGGARARRSERRADQPSVGARQFHHFAMSGPGRSRTATVRRPLVYSQLGSPMHADPCLCFLFSDPYENRTHLSSVRGWRPTDRRTGRVVPPIHFQ